MLRLERQYGLRSVALKWFSSYLSGRTFRVVYVGCTSSAVYIPCSVPQGSVLGPRLFIVILYTADLEDHVAEHGVSFHAFADDTQLYVHCRRDDVMSAVRRLENCIDDVSHWMSANRLELNADKTELLWARSHHGPAVLGSAGPSLQLKTETVMVSDQVRVLGETMSSDLSLDKHIGNVCVTCFYWLRQFRQVRRSLDVESAATLVHAFVTSRVDYCNAILVEASKSTTDKLQRVMMPLLASSPTRGSTIADSPICSTTSRTGSTFPSGCNTSCVQWFIAVVVGNGKPDVDGVRRKSTSDTSRYLSKIIDDDGQNLSQSRTSETRLCPSAPLNQVHWANSAAKLLYPEFLRRSKDPPPVIKIKCVKLRKCMCVKFCFIEF